MLKNYGLDISNKDSIILNILYKSYEYIIEQKIWKHARNSKNEEYVPNLDEKK